MKLKVAIIGFAQMHITTIAAAFSEMSDVYTFIGCSDTENKLTPVSTQEGTRLHTKNAIMQLNGGIRYYDNYLDLLELQPDLVIVTCENSFHVKVVTDALNHGCHVIMEKPMALSLAEAEEMVNTAHQNHVLLMVNWPTAWMPAFRTCHRMMTEGAVGRVLRFSYSNAESLGPFSYGQNLTEEEKLQEWWYHRELGGGGAVDYLGYGCSLSRWFLGTRAVSAMACGRNFLAGFADIEDHATLILSYPETQALIEATWATYSAGHIASGPNVFGDRGTLVADKKTQVLQLYTERFQTMPQVIDNDPFPAGRTTLAEEFKHALDTGEIFPLLSPELNLDAMAAMDAALRSIRSGKTETVKKND